MGDRIFTLDTDWSVAESPTSSKIHDEQVVSVFRFGFVWIFYLSLFRILYLNLSPILSIFVGKCSVVTVEFLVKH